MRVSPAGLAFLAAHEGIVPGVYRCPAGVLTYGIGHTSAAGEPRPWEMQREFDTSIDGIRKAIQVFMKDIERFEGRVERSLTDKDFPDIKGLVKQFEFDALVSFDLNTGGIFRAKLTRTLKTRRSCLPNANLSRYCTLTERAAKEFMGWSRPASIVPRRKAELRLFLSGLYGDSEISIYDGDRKKEELWPSRIFVKNTMDRRKFVDLVEKL